MKRGVVVFVLVAAIMVGLGFFIERILYPFKYKSEITLSARENNLEPSLVAGIIFVESRFKKDAVSNKGAIGLMQLMPATAKSFSDDENFSPESLYEPKVNIELGCRFLKYLFLKYGDEKTVVAMYNAGEKVAGQWLSKNNIIDEEKITYAETKNYIKKVEKYKKYYSKYF